MKEIEYKYVMRNLPTAMQSGPGSVKHVYRIVQFYKDGLRYRREIFGNDDGLHTTYLRMTKTYEGFGMSTESKPEYLTPNMWHEALKGVPAENIISKTRYIYHTADDKQVLSIDVFHHMTLIMMEIEIPTIEYEVTIPANIAEEIIAEVTGRVEFSNKTLAHA
jgi:CYTH domain-containing protein